MYTGMKIDKHTRKKINAAEIRFLKQIVNKTT